MRQSDDVARLVQRVHEPQAVLVEATLPLGLRQNGGDGLASAALFLLSVAELAALVHAPATLEVDLKVCAKLALLALVPLSELLGKQLYGLIPARLVGEECGENTVLREGQCAKVRTRRLGARECRSSRLERGALRLDSACRSAAASCRDHVAEIVAARRSETESTVRGVGHSVSSLLLNLALELARDEAGGQLSHQLLLALAVHDSCLLVSDCQVDLAKVVATQELLMNLGGAIRRGTAFALLLGRLCGKAPRALARQLLVRVR
mmetsp:Transcript_9998/g.28285  ORF Transcript_9998/g.28285 Transcript_9998/m.28285 type:complete len:265 (-) Transcript_9998:984-1778(-)